MNKDVLLDYVHAGRSRWESALTQLSPDQMTAPALFDGWSVKDLVAHIGTWERTAAAVFAALLSGQTPGFEIGETAGDEFNLDEFNARSFAEHHDQSLDEVMAGEQAAYQSFLSLVEGASEADLFDPNRFVWMQGDPFAEWVGANTFEHYDEHLADISTRLVFHAAGGAAADENVGQIANLPAGTPEGKLAICPTFSGQTSR